MTARAKIFVATPVYTGEVDYRFCESMIAATLHCAINHVELHLHIAARHSLIQFARNRLAQDFLNDKSYTHILWIDSDIGFDPSAVMRLLAHGKDVAGGVYLCKDNPPYFPAVSVEGEDTSKLHRAEVLPTGFLLCSRKAMEAVAETVDSYIHHHARQKLPTKHIFDLQLVSDGKDNQLLGEDVVLCNRLRELGFDLWLEPDINFRHCGRMEWNGNLKWSVDTEAAKHMTKSAA